MSWRWSCLPVLVGAVVSLPGCLDRPIEPAEPRTTSMVVGLVYEDRVDKIDLLLAVDNSQSMRDKQEILAKAVPALLRRLVSPRCLDVTTLAPTGSNVDASGACQSGSKPEFAPIRDLNVGVISSSLGGLVTNNECKVAADDGGRLLRLGPNGSPVETHNGNGYLAWDPDGIRGGEGDLAKLERSLEDLVRGAGENGCGFEMQLESITRFLVDPKPYMSLKPKDGGDGLIPQGLDQGLLDERAAFLRPDSLVAVMILSDENDCSLDVSKLPGDFISGVDGTAKNFDYYEATSECAVDPNDACCSSCKDVAPGCDVGANCADGGLYDGEHPNLKCAEQKRRYGVDFLYPTARYVNAFREPRIDRSRSDFKVVDEAAGEPNPLFFKEGADTQRPTDRVVVAGIVGVPWQAVAKRDPSTGEPALALGYKTFDELKGDLAALVGDPSRYLPPTDPFMIESTEPREGMSVLVGAALPGLNDINQGDYLHNPDFHQQHACVFPLPAPKSGDDCANCDPAAGCDLPLCMGTTQVYAKAYPGLRELAVLQGLEDQAVFASICAERTTGDTTEPGYGYNPAVNSLVEQLKSKLQNECLPRELTPDESGHVPCLVIEAFQTDTCQCGAGRATIAATAGNPKYNAVESILDMDGFEDRQFNCFCEITELVANEACKTDADPQAASQDDGWCYIDATTSPPVGDPNLVKDCPAEKERRLRFVGAADPPRPGALTFLACVSE